MKPDNEEVDLPTEFERYEFKNETSNKFWEVSVVENKLVVQFGRIGNKAQLREKEFESADLAAREKDKMVRKKLAKGYYKA